MVTFRWVLAATAVLVGSVSSQTFRRAVACPTLGCIYPPDQTDFLAGQYFDLRVEVQAPVNGSDAYNNGVPDPNFSLVIQRDRSPAVSAYSFFNINDSPLERWSFTYYEDLFAQDAKTPIIVNVTSKVYRRVALYKPGYYTATLSYYGSKTTVARWYVRDLSDVRRTKNIVLFIGDGMTTNMITAARLLAHKQVNGRYQSSLVLDEFPNIGHQMTHSLDSFITDSANSATALYSGHKSTVNALGVYRDSSPDPFDDPKFESIVEMFQRITGGHIGIVSTAYLADATPAAFTAHTPNRGLYPQIIDTFLNGATKNGTWTQFQGPDVLFGGGAENFIASLNKSFNGQDYYKLFAQRGYNVVNNKTSLLAGPNTKTLGVFCQSNLPVWLDRNIYKNNLLSFKNDPFGTNASATDLPGLKEMTLKAIDILAKTSGDAGWFLMSEAASIDKQMHTLDYDRALGDLLELDDTVRATIAKLAASGTLDETLVLVTADHGHGFDVMGSVDTKYLNSQTNDRARRKAVGTYALSGESQYVIASNTSIVPQLYYTNGSHFPAAWDPRYTFFQGVSADPDRRENYQVHSSGPRLPAVPIPSNGTNYYVNPTDSVTGFVVNGTLGTDEAQGVHSLTDVPVFAMGPCQELFSGSFNNIDIFFAMAECLGLSRFSNQTCPGKYKPTPGYLYGDTRHRWEGKHRDGEGWWSSGNHWGM